MSDSEPTAPTDPPAEPDAAPALSDEERRRRRAAIFGDVLPETTGDERDSGSDAPRGQDTSGDDWLRRQVPPHHGD